MTHAWYSFEEVRTKILSNEMSEDRSIAVIHQMDDETGSSISFSIASRNTFCTSLEMDTPPFI